MKSTGIKRYDMKMFSIIVSISLMILSIKKKRLKLFINLNERFGHPNFNCARFSRAIISCAQNRLE